MDAAITAKALESARGARAKRIRRRLNTKIAIRTKLSITAVEQQICKDGMHRTTSQSDAIQAVKQCPHPASIMAGMKSNKRLHKPD
jgi:hypothetical protein